MTTHIENHQINTDLTLHGSFQSPLTVRAIAIDNAKNLSRSAFQVVANASRNL
ncbi:hypothetical protein [Nostoc sp. DSM 114167]|jgi:hypothetical protein|uniref:hypothetical protein n=1 Tax=Nostoc sp. DSM 114167 TaxID=3439050 RepID=UPI0040458D58